MAQTHVVVIDYGAGNLRSAAKALEAVRPDATVTVSAEPTALSRATHILLPGVGAFADCAAGVRGVPGLFDALLEAVQIQRKPFLGVCVGMQLLAEKGLEHGEHQGFGWIPGAVTALPDEAGRFKIPHMGWNTLHMVKPHPLTAGFNEQTHLYFVHSFALEGETTSLADCVYSRRFPAIISHNNIAGIQAHPEKSSTAGLTFLKNFLSWRP
ncbi:MAG: imidazole glycerol phosphate synthase subunit HisH [Thalassospira sp.]|nr:imidazole glycerol phosphate synthase subunit HisH [Thalassospira sp.]